LGITKVQKKGSLSSIHRYNILLSGLFLALHFICFFAALHFTSIAKATLLGAMAPVFAATIEKIFFNRRWNRGMVLGIVFALLGALILQAGEIGDENNDNVGIILALFAALFLALLMVFAEKVRKNSDIFLFTRALYGWAAIILLGLSTTLNHSLFSFNSSNYIWLVLMGIIPTVFGHTLLYYAVRYVRPTVVSAVPLGEPIFASLMALAFFADTIPITTIIGGGVTLAGLYILVINH
jgi:drug/metabolite transporter (DMT)-like permease